MIFIHLIIAFFAILETRFLREATSYGKVEFNGGFLQRVQRGVGKALVTSLTLANPDTRY
jgi:hypothetical protein